MKTAKWLGMSMLMVAAIGWQAEGQEDRKKMTTENLIGRKIRGREPFFINSPQDS